MKNFERDNISLMRDVIGFLSILKVIDDVEYSKKKNIDNLYNWIENYAQNFDLLEDTTHITLNNTKFLLPPNYTIHSKDSIKSKSDGTLFFKIEDNSHNLDFYVDDYINYINNHKGEAKYGTYYVNNIKIHKVINLKSTTRRYWFKKDNNIFQIYSYFSNDCTDFNIHFLIKTLE